MNGTREKVLEALRNAPKKTLNERPEIQPLNELTLDSKSLFERFSAELTAQTGIVRHAENRTGLLTALSEICSSENITNIAVSSDCTIRSLDIDSWANASGITILNNDRINERESFRQAVFSADAGITGASFAVAESGTIGVIIDKDMPRLASIAPPVHIAVLPSSSLFPTYETALESVLVEAGSLPSQIVLITGPSATADISATPFKGMHGPGKIYVIFIDNL